jgi:hypothetical protein
MMALAIACAWAVVLAASPAFAAPIKVACIGDNNTHSDLYPVASPKEYPALLQTKMGAGYNVVSFGDCCSSVVQGYNAGETHPYVNGALAGRGPGYKESLTFMPDIVIIGAFGRHDWGIQRAINPFNLAKFQTDYDDLVSRYIALPNHPKIYVCTPIPILFGMGTVPDNGTTTESVLPAIKAVAAKYNLPIIDLYAAFTGRKDLFRNPPLADGEGEHLNDTGGYQHLADTVAAALMGGGGDGGVSQGVPDAGAAGTDAAADDAGGPSSPAPDAAATNDAGTPGTGLGPTGSDDAGGSTTPTQGGSSGGGNEAGAANNGSASGSGGASSSGCSMSGRGCLPSSMALIAGATMGLFVARRRRKPTVQQQQ